MDYNIKLGVQIDESSIVKIKSDLDTKLQDKKINIRIDSKELEQIKDLLNNIYLELGRLESKNGFSSATKGAKNFNKELEKTTRHIKNQTFATDNWVYNWSKAMQSFLTYNTVTQFFYTVSNGIKDMIRQVKELDDALTEFKKVSDLSGESLERYVDKAYEMGEAVAKTGTEMIEAATSFKKSGYTDEMSLELGTIASMYTNIADEAISSADAADMIIAQMKAFKIEAQDAIHIIDAINEVSNNYAVSSADIANNLGKASAVMANAGNSMEQYIGLMTAATEVTRNASKAANGLKTLTLRLQGMNDEGEKDLKVQSQIEALFQKLGISVYKANGELKNTYEILETLAPVYQKLTNAEKAYVTETIAGKYQAQNAAAILSNWQTAVNATTTAINSNGSAMEENAKVLDSIKGKTAAFNSAVEQLAKNLIDSGLIKWVIEFGTALVKFAGSGFSVFAIKASVMFLVLRGGISLFQKLTKSTLQYTGTIPKLVQSIVYLTKGERGLGVYLTKNQEGFAALTAAEKRKQLQDVATAASTTALNAALAASSIIIMGAITLYQEYQRKQAETAENALNALKETENKIDDLNGTINSIKSLRETLDDSSSSYKDAREAREELIKIQNDLIENYGGEADKIDLVSGSIEEQIKRLKELKAEYASQQLAENESAYNTARDKIYGSRYKTKMGSTYTGEDKKVQKILEQYNADYWYKTGGDLGIGRGYYFDAKNLDNAKKALEEWKKYLQENKKELIKTGEITKKEYEHDLKYIDEQLKKIKEKYDVYYNTLNEQQKLELTAANFDDFKDKLLGLSSSNVLTKDSVAALINEYPGLQEALKKNGYTIEKLLNEYQNYNQITDLIAKKSTPELKERLKELAGQVVITEEDVDNLKEVFGDELAKILEGTGVTFEDFINKFKHAVQQSHDLINVFSTLKSQMDDLESGFGYLKNAVDEFNNEGYITAETLLKLINLDMLKYLEFTEDGLIANTEALVDNADALKYAALMNLQAAFAQDAYAIATGDITNASQTAISIINGLGDQTYDAGAMAEAAAGKFFKLGAGITYAKEAAKKEKKKLNITEEIEGQLAQLETVYNKYAQAIVATNYSSSGKKYTGSSSGSSSSKSSQKEWWEKEFDALKDQFDYSEITIEQYINGLEGLLGKLDKGSDAWRKINKELQKQRLDKVKDDYDAGRISLNQYIISLQNLQQAYKDGTAEWNKLADAIKKAKLDQLKEQQNDLKAALSAVNNVLQVQVNEYKELKDAADKKYDDEIEKLNDLRDSLNDNNDDYERAQKAVVKFLNEQLDSINSQKDSIEDYYDNVIDSIEKMNEDTQESIELAEAYEALINAMTQKTKKVWKEGLGWTWAADQKAIEDAKKTYDDLVKNATTKEIEKQKDKTIKSLEEQISSLQEYIDSWDKVFDKFDNEKNTNLANLLLGDNWTEMVSQLDPQVVEDFSNAYYDLQKNLEETEKQIEILNKQKEEEDKYWNNLIDDLENYKDKWSDIANAYTDAQDALKAKQIIGVNWEKEILDKRLDVLENFKNKYNAILAEIDKVDNMSTAQAAGYTALKLPGYANGGEVNYTGLAVLHGTPNKPEYVLNNTQMRNLLGNLTKPRFTSVNNNGNSSNVYNYNFGNIELPNVNNAKQFINELKSLVNTSKNL